MNMFKLDWTNLEVVRTFFDSLQGNETLLIVKHASRPTYTIVHAVNRHLWDIPGCVVIHPTH